MKKVSACVSDNSHCLSPILRISEWLVAINGMPPVGEETGRDDLVLFYFHPGLGLDASCLSDILSRILGHLIV